MKELLVLRHAKSSWDTDGMDDHERPLNDRGKRDAPRMGKLLAAEEILPDAVLSSDARRAIKTTRMVCEEAGYTGAIDVRKDFYLAEPITYIEALQGLPKEAGRALIVGHNPGMEVLVASLTRRREEMPTCALAHILFAISHWNELQLSTPGMLKYVWRPKELPDAS